MELELPRPVAAGLIFIVVLVLCGAVGYSVSPRTGEGRPILLSPDVRAIESYRRESLGWVAEWQRQADTLRAVLEDEGDLFAVSQQAQGAFIQATELASEVEAVDPPASLIGLSEQITETANAFSSASLSVARWVSAPSAENKMNAENELAVAEHLLSKLQANEWMQEVQR